jgi:tetratricopeptide (TPR) repeat protein
MASLKAAVLRPRRLVAGLALLAVVAAGLVATEPHLRGWYHFRAARSALGRYHNPQAVRHLQACLRVWPDDAAVLLLTARAARRAGSYEEAQRCLDKYQQARGLDDALSLEQILLSAERRVDQASEVCRRYVEQDHPDTPLILEALTRGYLRQFRLREARSCLTRWLQRQPENPQAFCLEGELHLDYERARSRAEESYRRAVELDPEHEEARLGLAISLLESRAFAEAGEHLEFLRQCQPGNLRVQVGVAECRHGLGHGAEAAQLLDRVLAQEPGYPHALALYGRIALEDQQYPEAERRLRQALDANPSDYAARHNLILCLHRSGKEVEAEQQREQLKQMEDDVRRFNEIVTREMLHRPHDASLHFKLGQLLLRGGRREEGLRWLHSALREDPQFAPALQALSEYYRQAAKQ